MIALDTNIVLRYLIKDDAEQARLATDYLRQHRCLLLPTVVLEAVWVMGSRRGYALAPATVAERRGRSPVCPRLSWSRRPGLRRRSTGSRRGWILPTPCIWHWPAISVW